MISKYLPSAPASSSLILVYFLFSNNLSFGTCQQHGGGIEGGGAGMDGLDHHMPGQENLPGGAGGSVYHHTPLPGVENRPGGSAGGRLQCMKESNEVLINSEVRNEMSKLHADIGKLDISTVCTELETPENAVVSGERYDCILDFEEEFGVGLKSACIQSNGTFVERSTKVHCLGQQSSNKDNEDAPTYSWEFLNFPICSGADCSEADIDRLLNRNVIQIESALQAHLNHAVCRGDAFGQAGPAGSEELRDWINKEEENGIDATVVKETKQDVEEKSGVANAVSRASSSAVMAMMSFMTLVFYSW